MRDAPATGGECVIGVKTDVSSFFEWFPHRAHEIEIINLVFLPLARLDREKGEFLPVLAESWRFEDGGKELEITLRSDAVWQDGHPVCAEDVLFTHQLQIDERLGWYGARHKQRIESVERVDERTVRFHFKRAYPDSLHDAVIGNIYPAHLLKELPVEGLEESEFSRRPVGCGPFRVGRRVPGEALELLASETCFRGRPHLDRLEFRVVRDKQTRALIFEAGELDLLRLASPEQFDRLRRAGYQGHEATGLKYTVVVWNTTDPLIEDARLRRAFAMAFDRERMVQLAQRGHGSLVPGPIHPGSWAYSVDLPRLTFEPAEASRMLDELGWRDRDGDGVRENGTQDLEFSLAIPAGAQFYINVAALIRDDLARVGVRVNTTLLEGGAYQEAVYERSSQAVLVTERADDKVDLSGLAHSSSIGDDGTNYAGYASPAFDEVCERAIAARTQDEAKKHWREACEILMKDQPYTFLFYRNDTHLFVPRFRGVRIDANGLFANVLEWRDGEH